ncbi:MAG TPA: metallophosphoesterase [Polyangia bacterium]|nr:metallophosphoesterase [Polyangia bacterium]
MLNVPRKILNLSVVAAAGLALVTGCEGTPSSGTGSPAGGAVGAVALVVNGVPPATFNSFSYSLTGPTSRTGAIDTTNSSTVSAVIGAVAAGAGYALTLSGTSTDGQTTCSGASTAFSVAAGATTSVSIVVDCHRPPSTGSIQINGTINVCPLITSVSANPPVGNVISLASVANDPDGAPQPLTYAWTTGSGTLSSATAQNPTLTCTAPGPVSLTLTVSDGDAGCVATFSVAVTCPADAALNESAWVEIGANNQAIARLLTPYNSCPSITVDGVTSPMTVRAPAGTMPLRPTSTDATLAAAMTSGNSKPSVFTKTSCEFLLPAGATSATAAGIKLPLPKPVVNRVAIIGDTGCRISIGNVYQACSDPSQWPFPVIAQAAAAMQPDLVLHVGDYHYRDNPCPPGNTACTGTPWGYGSDVWDADLFTPAAPLLAAAPWVMVRGNHETCNRAGQGWYRYLDPNPYDATGVKTCNDPANDNAGNFNDPWAVSFGDTQFVVFDSANASKTAYSPAAFQPYTSELASAAGLATPTFLNIWAVHHPVLGYSAANPPTIGNAGLQSVMNAAFPGNYYPPNIGIAVHGHVHDFQALDFASNHPATFVAGNGGDNLDTALPATFNPNGDLPAPGTVVNAFAFSQEFGFMVMDRVGSVGSKNWKFTSYRTNGTIIAVCTMAPPAACSGVCDSTPGTRISCTDGTGNVVGTYANIP